MPETHERRGTPPGTDKPPETGAGRDPRDSAKETVDEVRRATRDAAREAREAGKEAVAQRSQRQKGRAEATLGSVARALYEASETFRRDERDQLGRYTGRAADRVERLGDYLEDRDLDALLRDARSMARRRPELFIGGCYFTGLLLGRFLKSSEEAHGVEEHPLPPQRPATRVPAEGPLGPESPMPERPPVTTQPPPGVR